MQADTSAPETGIDEARLKLSAELIKLAQQTAARIRFIEDASLLEPTSAALARCLVPHMSRQNKVNPGMYTQRGRLTQDDAAREMRKQRAIGSQHTWQPVQRDTDAAPGPTAEPDRDSETTETSRDRQASEATSQTGRIREARPGQAGSRRGQAAKTAGRRGRRRRRRTPRPQGGRRRATAYWRLARKAKSAKPAAKVGGDGQGARPGNAERAETLFGRATLE